MARGRFYHDPARKNIEQYQDFSGGLNTMSSNDNIQDRELMKLENVNLGDRGSISRRHGYTSEPNPNAKGLPQGVFRHHRQFMPYNLLGVDGSFDGLNKTNGPYSTVGGWFVNGLNDHKNAYKVDREQSEDLIKNGDFEDGTNHWDLNVSDRAYGDSFITRSGYALSDDRVLAVRVLKNHIGILNEYQKDYVPAEPGEVFDVSVNYIQGASSLGGRAYRAHIIASVKFADGRPNQRFYLHGYDVHYTWKEIKGKFTMPAGASEVKFGVGILDNDLSQNSLVYFDKVRAFRQTSKNLSENAQFEQLPLGKSWSVTGIKDGWYSHVYESAYAFTGDYVLGIIRDKKLTGEGNVHNVYQDKSIPVNEGDIMTSNVKYITAASMLGKRAEGIQLLAWVTLKNGSTKLLFERKYGTIQAKWQTFSAEFEMPKDAVSVRMGVGVVDKQKHSVGCYFDNFWCYRTENVIVNGDFADKQAHWELDAVETSAGYSEVFESQYAQSGMHVLGIVSRQWHGGYYNQYQANWIKTKPGEDFYVSTSYIQGAQMLGGRPSRVHIVAQIRKKDGSSDFESINKYDVNASWKLLSGNFKMPKNAVEVRFGVGMVDDDYNTATVVYFDNLYARRDIAGSTDSAVAIRSEPDNDNLRRGLGYVMDGIEPNKYYVFAVDFKTDGAGTGSIAVRDKRYGNFPADFPKNIEKVFTDKPTDWTTQYMAFKTYPGMTEGVAYVYNRSPVGQANTVYYDNARIYELRVEQYENIDDLDIEEEFPYRVGALVNESITETITVVGGTFYVDGVEKEVEENLTVQKDRIMEAVSWKNNLYIASGSGLLVYNGSTIAEITPYIPDSLETLYIGTNGLITNPFEISDEEQEVVELKRIHFDKRYGVTNQDVTITVGVGKPNAVGVKYRFERRNVRDKEDYWEIIQDYSPDNAVTFSTNISGEYQFRIRIRQDGEEYKDDEYLEEYLIPKYIVRPNKVDENDVPIDANTISMCNRIGLHWNRLIMFGDETKPDVMYISDLHNPAYFPINNTLQFENPRKEAITSVLKYRDNLVIFTKSSIQALYGTNPEDFERVMLNTDIGCIAPRSAKVVKNSVIFQSQEGIALLKTVGMSESRYNVDFIDNKIKNLVEYDTNAVAHVRDNQYCIEYPYRKKMLRYYYEWDVWVMDHSDTFDWTDAVIEDGKIFALGMNGRLILDSEDYADEGYSFQASIGTKLFDFGEPYSTKKVRQLQIMFDTLVVDTNVNVYVYMDKMYTGSRVTKETDYEISVNDVITNLEELKYGYNIPKQEIWRTYITPESSNPIKKGYAHDNFGDKDIIKNFAETNEGYAVYSGGSSEGLQVKNKVLYQVRSEDQWLFETLAVMEDGTLKIIEGYENTDPDLTGVVHTFHEGPWLVKDGVARTEFPTNPFIISNFQPAPRQGIGQRADGSYVILTAHGRYGAHYQGTSLADFAKMFADEKCVVAYQLSPIAQAYLGGYVVDTRFDGLQRAVPDFLYFTKDVVTVVESARDSLIAAETVVLSPEQDIYKLQCPGKGMTTGTLLTHSENKPLKIDGLGYVFKLKKP